MATQHAAAPAQTLIIAHRGASGYLPEHTLPAYAYAHAQGADMLEPDVVLTKDGVPLCSHDITLERTTNAEAIFPNRARSDGHWYAIDFTLDELRTLDVDGPQDRFKHAGGIAPGFKLATLREMLDLVRTLNATTGRSVGIVPELKRPSFHRDAGLPMEQPVVALLAEFGYRARADACILQCFEAATLRTVRDELKCDLRLLLAVGEQSQLEAIGGVSGVAQIADVLAPNKKLIDDSAGKLVADAHAAGLVVIPWTFGTDEAELGRFIHQYGVDAMFCDYPDVALRARESR